MLQYLWWVNYGTSCTLCSEIETINPSSTPATPSPTQQLLPLYQQSLAKHFRPKTIHTCPYPGVGLVGFCGANWSVQSAPGKFSNSVDRRWGQKNLLALYFLACLRDSKQTFALMGYRIINQGPGVNGSTMAHRVNSMVHKGYSLGHSDRYSSELSHLTDELTFVRCRSGWFIGISWFSGEFCVWLFSKGVPLHCQPLFQLWS